MKSHIIFLCKIDVALHVLCLFSISETAAAEELAQQRGGRYFVLGQRQEVVQEAEQAGCLGILGRVARYDP